MRCKKIACVFISLFTAFVLLPIAVSADMGPKPSVNLKFAGMEDRTFYVTLLSEKESTGPYSHSSAPIDENSYLISENKAEGLKAWQAFRDYTDADGFYFIEYFKRSNEEGSFGWTYYPPSTFKVLIYFVDDGSFLSSQVTEKYAFDSYYQVAASKDESRLDLQKSYDYSSELLSMAARILLTIAVEVLVALLFGLKKKNLLLFILLVNAFTQIILNVLLNIINYSGGGFAYVFNYVWMELLIVLIETLVFSWYFKKIRPENPIKSWVAPCFAVVANTVSFGVGMLISIKLPGIF